MSQDNHQPEELPEAALLRAGLQRAWEELSADATPDERVPGQPERIIIYMMTVPEPPVSPPEAPDA